MVLTLHAFRVKRRDYKIGRFISVKETTDHFNTQISITANRSLLLGVYYASIYERIILGGLLRMGRQLPV